MYEKNIKLQRARTRGRIFGSLESRRTSRIAKMKNSPAAAAISAQAQNQGGPPAHCDKATAASPISPRRVRPPA